MHLLTFYPYINVILFSVIGDVVTLPQGLFKTDNKEWMFALISPDDEKSSSAAKLCTCVEQLEGCKQTSAKVHGLRLILFAHVCVLSCIYIKFKRSFIFQR